MGRPPYFTDFEVAQACAAVLVLLVLVVVQRSRWRIALLATSLAVAVLAPYVVAGGRAREVIDSEKVLEIAAVLAALAGADRRRPMSVVLSVSALVAFVLVARLLPSGGLTLAAILLAWVAAAAVSGAKLPRGLAAATRAPPRWLDPAIFFVATAAAAIVSTIVLERYVLSGDEWANTYQADVFGHFGIHGTPRPCARVFQNWWVLDWQGRSFSQYTPSWPLFMAPFQRLGQVWLAGPFMLGIVAVGVARLARRVTPARPVAVSVVAAGVAVSSPALLLNAASRYPHTMVCGMLAWMIESLCVIASSPPRPVLWGIVLGVSAALLLGARPLDGGTLGLPVACYFLWAWARRRLPSRAAIATMVSFVVLAGFTLVVLRLQVGRWFATGYAISAKIREMPPPRFSVPNGAETINSLAIPKIAWWWWPCAPAAAVAALVGLRARTSPAAALLVSGGALHTLAYTFESYMRTGEDSGYSPRFHLPVIVLVAVFTAVAVVETWRAAGSYVVPAVVLATFAFGTMRIATSVYPKFRSWLHEKHALARAIERDKLHHAVVVVHDGATAEQPWDATQNLPSQKDPDVLIVTDYRAGDDFRCARRTFAGRTWYEAGGKAEVMLKPLKP